MTGDQRSARHHLRPQQAEVRLPRWLPPKAAARSALDQALGRHVDVALDKPSTANTVVAGTAHPTLNDLLDHWLAHLRTKKAVRLRTIGRYRQLLEHHLRPYLGTLPVSALCPRDRSRPAAHGAQRQSGDDTE